MEKGYEYSTNIEELARQADVGVQPALRELIHKRLKAVRDELLAKATADIDELLAKLALDISANVEARVLSAYRPADGVTEVTILVDRRPVAKRVVREFVTEVPESRK